MTDPLRLFVQTVGTFTPEAALDRLREVHAVDGIETLVVGWPLTPEGAEGEAVERVRAYVDELRRALPDVEMVAQDERFTSKRAARRLAEAGVRRSKRRRQTGRLDAASAALILEDYLEGTA